MSGKSTKRTLIIGGAVVFVAAFAYLLSGKIGSSLVYFYTPSELLAQGTKAYDAPVRLGGMVVPGSVKWDANSLDLQFTMQDGKAQVPVHSHGAPPQMFRDGIGVVVEGKYTAAGTFEATNLLVKHSNEYRPPKNGQMPAEMYKSLIKGGN
ncbi:MAG TPA: cytochrome c maturation protein CcmE [Gemmatimonadaceae bacterium]|nr:cytochrome c maturation protein CcmE [Gemmatimonadaceae bacterium]